jgi:hypothetical protein
LQGRKKSYSIIENKYEATENMEDEINLALNQEQETKDFLDLYSS